ncbi:MAG: Two-component system response regulator DccR [uncultured Sulfurovum sp.]|uniref:Two-component system response regulator DccR n=1 Tax=uncultured Sulfurovum sp. TaxID=269237 RepID=A0A6S6SRS4_9BACT|nr:MAG: Two-component system response regulator DccR [uncultured Sulfurovum sp.]
MTILLLEDDLMLSEVIIEHLEAFNYVVTTVYDGIEAEDLLFESTFDLLLLDVNVPFLNGFELLKNLRQAGNNTPTIFITSMNRSEDVLEGFELGASDYLKKPFEMLELKARIDNIKRQFKIDMAEQYQLSENISYDVSRHSLKVEDKVIKLSKKEGEFLAYFLRHKGEVLSADTLMVNVWSYDTAPSSATLRTYIKTLRKYLGENAISTIRGVGYVFN